MKVLIVYYSTYGNVYRMAALVAEGAKEIPGVQPVVRTVPELIPKPVIDSREDMKAGREMQKDIPLVTMDDFREAGAIAFGTPTRFGNVSAQLKNQIDQLTSLWLKGELEGKPAGVFVATSSLHGGQETTILTLMAPLLHLGMILVVSRIPLRNYSPRRVAAHHTVLGTSREMITSVKSTNRRRRSAALLAAV
jgi:NAD(P)H dehydrogenase (quinone)